VTIVERAIERLRRQGGHPTAPATVAVGTMVHESAPDLAQASSARRILIDRDALRQAGYLPETAVDRRFASYFRQIKRPLITKVQSAADAAGPNPRVIVMTSALPGDGKTFTSINLALSLAHERDVSVVLVDADIPKPHVSRIFGVDAEPGLTDALASVDLDIESLVLPTDVGNLSVLPAGRGADNATELLASARMGAVLTRLLSRHPRRIVLLDSPPLMVSSEARSLVAIAGQLVMVVRSGRTPRKAVLDALAEIGAERSVSLVLNQGPTGFGGGYGAYGDYGAYGESGAEKA
jgi:exopolysaccharide/PEP-CTERM locus tyrosine autokinase